ncbi:FG-GAP-like repeat-containing protein [Pedococcus sp. 2YAF34]|uniref:FG-GAP-like repeat-containing protein n=1 Tax=Pedococcus sp. 2YAF34 TaxID=3233032 RepID=UPI003F9BB31E
MRHRIAGVLTVAALVTAAAVVAVPGTQVDGGLGTLFSARDVTGDGKVELGVVTTGGTLRIYKGRGNGTFSSAVAVSSGWAPYL